LWATLALANRVYSGDSCATRSSRRAIERQHWVSEKTLYERLNVHFFLVLGLDHFSKTFRVNNREINLQLFDTGGMQVVFEKIVQFHFNLF
jgi:predicted aspartyl protease